MRPPAGAAGSARTALAARTARSPSHPSVEFRHRCDESEAADVTPIHLNEEKPMQSRSESIPRVKQPAISVRQLRKTYPGGVEAVKAIDFEVAAGEVFGLLGPNGAGKSTTIGMLTTTVRPTGGTARLAGFDVAREPLAARRVSSVVFQEPVVDRSLTGRRNLELHARLWRVTPSDAEPRIAELAAALGVAALLDRPVGSYSGGERRRLELARALASHPQGLVL